MTRLTAVVIAATLGCGCAAVALTGAVSAAASRRGPTALNNRRAARLDAAELLRELQLPAGATRTATEPAGDNGWLKPPSALIATTARIDVHAWYRVPGKPASVFAFLDAHPPVGATTFATGSGGNRRTSTSFQTIDFSWPPIPGVLGFRELAVTVTALPGGVTGVLAAAESDWVVPRPPSERIPAGVREIDITGAKLGGPVTLSLRVANPAKVRQIVSLFDAMPIVQPTTYMCPALMGAGARMIAFEFRAGVGGQLLAKASYIAYRNLAGSSGPCNPIQVTVDGHRGKPLIGGAFVRRVDRLLGVSLRRGRV